MLANNADFKYETPYKGQFGIPQCQTNGTVTLQCGAKKNRYNIIRINTYTPNTNIEDNHLKKRLTEPHYKITSDILLLFTLNTGNKVL